MRQQSSSPGIYPTTLKQEMPVRVALDRPVLPNCGSSTAFAR